ncbi:MAG: phosphatidate cytidylyltransferase [Phycisphaerales bacterium]
MAALLGVFWLDDWLDTLRLEGWWSEVFFGRTYLPSGLALFAAAACVLPFASWELTRIFRANHIDASPWITTIAAELGLMLNYAVSKDMEAVTSAAIISTGLVGMFVASLWYFSRGKNVDGVVAAAGGAMFAMIYLGLMAGFYLTLRRWESAWLILAVILTTKSCDIGAYFTGRAFGRTKLIEWLSPKKTWEGLMGGVATAALVGVGFALLGRQVQDVEIQDGLVHHYVFPLWFAALAGMLFAIVGQIGDLTASLLKRDAGLKDSSRMIPGFGGVLDVLDSPLLVAPVAYWMFSL